MKTRIKVIAAFWISVTYIIVMGFYVKTEAAVVQLQNGTATFSQTNCSVFSPDLSVNGNLYDQGWAIATECGCPSYNTTSSQTAVWQTAVDVNASQLHFRMHQNWGGQHLIGRFRFSLTSDNRTTFTDGLDNGGNVTANWSVLTNPTVNGPAGMTFTTLDDSSILAVGTIADTGYYDVWYAGNFTKITGVRLEVIEDSTLPTNGPGLMPCNGNFVLSELELSAEPKIAGCLQMNGQPVVDSAVELKQDTEKKQVTSTDSAGCYSFEKAIPGIPFKITIHGPIVE